MRSVLLGLLLLVSPLLRGDEGMWLFNAPPREQLRARYGFEPTAQWLEHLQRSSVRFSNGGSGAFVSRDALVITNHHIGIDCLQEQSDEKNDRVTSGYRAKTRADELPCPALVLHVLTGIEDVTARVHAAGEKREQVIAELEEAARPAEVVALHQGAVYHLYRYHAYGDVRLVFAPEEDAAFFGGDPDNFEYPRYNFDVCFFRAYEDGRPAKIEHWLTWSASGAKEGELLFASGHPGVTERSLTATHLAYIRDVQDRLQLERARRREQVLRNFAQRSAESARRSTNELLLIENRRKALEGELAALQDPSLIAGKRAEEARLREKLSIDAELQAIDRAVAAARALFLEVRLFEGGWAFDSALFAQARQLVRGTKVGEVATRRALLDGGPAAIKASTDPMIVVARLADERARTLRRRWIAEVEEPMRAAYSRIAQARFRTGAATYPDATFTLRLSFGRVLGYVDEEGVQQPWATNIGGIYERAAARGNVEPYDLPRRWFERKEHVDLATPFNFVAAMDTTGGSSGSPLVNRSGELAGIVFDGNLPTLGFSFAYQERDGRTIGVHARAIVEILRAIYGATELVSELMVDG